MPNFPENAILFCRVFSAYPCSFYRTVSQDARIFTMQIPEYRFFKIQGLLHVTATALPDLLEFFLPEETDDKGNADHTGHHIGKRLGDLHTQQTQQGNGDQKHGNGHRTGADQ